MGMSPSPAGTTGRGTRTDVPTRRLCIQTRVGGLRSPQRAQYGPPLPPCDSLRLEVALGDLEAGQAVLAPHFHHLIAVVEQEEDPESVGDVRLVDLVLDDRVF